VSEDITPSAPRKRRSPRHVKAAAKILQKEARKILRKHARRIPPDAVSAMRACVSAMDTQRSAGNWHQLEDEAEVLDELLHQHASFARKSALRETVENIGIAILVAIGLRSCFYEPFKIPSGSMMPTLRTGDHIFVNKFAYGVQIPLTTTVAGEDMLDEIKPGDVVVFRYPLDESEDFIKRVMGLPGDVVRVEGRDVWVKRAGEADFVKLERTVSDQKCTDEAGISIVEHCKIYEETVGDRSYQVRYLTDVDPRSETGARTFEVPDGHLLVMGDNRNLSHDSLQWTAEVEAVSADRVLTVKDLRDLTTETLFTVTRPRGDENNEDPSFDSVLYLADHRAIEQDLRLEVWRQPTLGADALFRGVTSRMADGEVLSIDALVERNKKIQPREMEQIKQVGADIAQLSYASYERHFEATWRLKEPDTVFRILCGRADCKSEGQLAKRIADITSTYHADHEQAARELIEGQKSVRYSQHWRAREDAKERYIDIHWGNPKGTGPANEVRLRAWRGPDEGVELLRDVALASAGSTRAQAQAVAEVGEDAWLVEGEDGFSVVVSDLEQQMLGFLECGKQRCKTVEEAKELGKLVGQKLPAASRDRRRLREVLGQKDIGAWPERPSPMPKLYEWDRVTLDGTVRGGSHALSLRVHHKPPQGIEAAAGEWMQELDRPEEVQGLGAKAWYGSGPGGHRFVFVVPQTDAAFSVRCGAGLCPDKDTAHNLARRAAEKAMSAGNFIDPEAQRSRPYVPRGNVKGRAERIWLPFSRFWLEVR
jgi:signal peptidase I